MPNTFGHLFRITTWGESHGMGVGVVIDGCPARLPLEIGHIQKELNRRRPGQSKIVTPRKELDTCEILSGVFKGQTLGSPIAVLVRNLDQRPEAYSEMETQYRPSHADYTYDVKYGIRNWQGGGRASARETIGRVAGGAVAKQLLKILVPKLKILTFVSQVHSLKASYKKDKLTQELIETNSLRWPNAKTASKAIQLIKAVQSTGDSVGGVITCIVKNAPVGLGDPVFDKFEADLAKAMLSLPATKGFEIGSGFSGTRLKGSEHNDTFHIKNKKIRTRTNHSGGVQGGITNGEDIIFQVAFKPTATIAKTQETVTNQGKQSLLRARGRHDPCVLPRAVPIVEAMTNLVLVDHFLRHKATSINELAC